MHSLVNGAQTLSEGEWVKFLNYVNSWPSTVENIISFVGKTRSYDQIGKEYKEYVFNLYLRMLKNVFWEKAQLQGFKKVEPYKKIFLA